MVAVQGPLACRAIASLANADPAELSYYTGRSGTVCGRACGDFPDGYTGEDGCELILDREFAAEVANGILDKVKGDGGMPAGLGARDTLRLEAAMPLYGHELTEATNAARTGLKFAISLKNREFCWIGNETNGR